MFHLQSLCRCCLCHLFLLFLFNQKVNQIYRFIVDSRNKACRSIEAVLVLTCGRRSESMLLELTCASGWEMLPLLKGVGSMVCRPHITRNPPLIDKLNTPFKLWLFLHDSVVISPVSQFHVATVKFWVGGLFLLTCNNTCCYQSVYFTKNTSQLKIHNKFCSAQWFVGLIL